LVGAEARAVADGFIWLILCVCGLALVLGGAVAYWSMGAIRPLSALTQAMKRLADGDFSVTVPSLGRGDEVGAMASTVEYSKKAVVSGSVYNRRRLTSSISLTRS
jgi:methyl-accepting chemotaxis protein